MEPRYGKLSFRLRPPPEPKGEPLKEPLHIRSRRRSSGKARNRRLSPRRHYRSIEPASYAVQDTKLLSLHKRKKIGDVRRIEIYDVERQADVYEDGKITAITITTPFMYDLTVTVNHRSGVTDTERIEQIDIPPEDLLVKTILKIHKDMGFDYERQEHEEEEGEIGHFITTHTFRKDGEIAKEWSYPSGDLVDVH